MKKDKKKEKTAKPKPRRKPHDRLQAKPVCNCKFGCLDWNSHFAIHGASRIRQRSVLADPDFNLMGL